MSSTPYRVQDLVGASPFTGTAAHTILDTPFADIPDDVEPGDRFYFETNVAIQKTSGTSYSVYQRLLLDGVAAHTENIAQIGIHVDARFLVCRYALTVIDATHCYITADVTLSGTGGFGPNPQYRSNPATPLPAFDVGSPVPIDFTVELSSAGATCTPQLIDGWKVLNLGGAVSVGAVASVNGVAPDISGNVEINYADVGALSIQFANMPLVEFDSVNNYYNRRALGSSDYPHLYYGPFNPTDAPYINPIEPFLGGTDIWLQQG